MRNRMNPTRFLVALALVAFALAGAGCSGDDDPTAPAPPGHSASRQYDDLLLTISTDKASYVFGETVNLVAALTNTSDGPVDIDFRAGYFNVNLNVIRDDNYSLYAGGEGHTELTTLAAKTTLTYTFAWNQTTRPTTQPTDRGIYEVRSQVQLEEQDNLVAGGLYIQLR